MADDVRQGGTGVVNRPGETPPCGAEADRPVAGAGATVVALSDVARETRYPMLGRVEAYWQELRGNRLVPARTEVDPRRIEDALEYAFILERIAPGMARFRLAGMHLNDLMGMEVRGMPLTAFFDPEARKTVSAALERVFTEPALATLTLAGERGIGRPALEGRLLMLPLKSDFGEVSRVLGCLATIGPMGRTPRRFHVTAERIRPVAGTGAAPTQPADGALWEAARPVRPRRPQIDPERGTQPRPARAETPLGVPPRLARAEDAPRDHGAAPRPPRSEGRPHLYIVSSNDS